MNLLTAVRNNLSILIICSFFLAVSLFNIKSSGVSTDEISPALWSVHVLTGNNVFLNNTTGIKLFGRLFPADMHYRGYVFQLPSYMLFPLFALLGLNLFAFKLSCILISMFTIVLVFKILDQILDRRFAVFTSWLLAFSSLYVHYARISLNATEPFITFLFLMSLLLFLSFLKSRKLHYIYMSMLFLGSGMSVKISAAARIIAAAAVASVFCLRQTAELLRSLTIKNLLICLLFFSAGSSLFIYYNVASGAKSFSLIKYISGEEKTIDDVDNRDLIANIRIRLSHFRSIVREEQDRGEYPYFYRLETPLNSVSSGVIEAFFWFSLLLNIFILLLKKDPLLNRIFLSIYLFYGLMLFLSVFSPGSIERYHLVLMYPFPQFVMASSILLSSEFIKRKIFKKLYSYSLLLILLFFSSVHLYSYHKVLYDTGGKTYWSRYDRQIYDYVSELPAGRVYMLDWGLHDVFVFYSLGKMDFKERLDMLSDLGRLKEMIWSIINKEGESYFVRICSDKESARRLETLKDAVAAADKSIELIYSIRNKIGDDVFEVYRSG